MLHYYYFYHLAPEIRKIEAIVEKARVHNRKGTFEALSTYMGSRIPLLLSN